MVAAVQRREQIIDQMAPASGVDDRRRAAAGKSLVSDVLSLGVIGSRQTRMSLRAMSSQPTAPA